MLDGARTGERITLFRDQRRRRLLQRRCRNDILPPARNNWVTLAAVADNNRATVIKVGELTRGRMEFRRLTACKHTYTHMQHRSGLPVSPVYI